MSSRAIVSVTNDLYTDQRVHKVCTFLVAQGYEVLLVGRKRRSSIPLPPREYKTHRMKLLFETGAKFYAFFNFRLFLFLLFRKADILVSNDLDTLLANHLANKFKRKTRLVYDSHEYFTEVPELTSRPKVQKIWLKIEEWIFPKLKDVYTVNGSIAEIYSKKYKKNIRIVRNISPLWIRKKLQSKKALGIPENVPLIILQGAGINVERGAEEAVEAMKSVDAVLLIVGDGDVVPDLKKYVASEGKMLSEKVLFFGKQPYDVMMNYTSYADIGLTLDKPNSLNYALSLPNKVFDYMHTNTAVVATEIKEVAHVIRTNKIGVILEEFTVENLARVLNELIADRNRLDEFQANCAIAAKTENWEKETEILAEIYPKVE
ncbi:MAG: glycosyltransferase family 4 protein [Crocinitomicaceae bacterium]|nr:glycosyltransferase family 4 protein [Flavobacteriales bacterium]NQZ36365.1 glycosyltransferase family 4 protein [Crocinitomicaceae bacterium]